MVTIATGHLNQFGGTELWTITLANALAKKHDVNVYCKDYSQEVIKHLEVDLVTNYDYSDVVIANHPNKTNPPLNKTILMTHSYFLSVERFVLGAKKYISISKELQEIEQKRGYESKVILNPIFKSYKRKTKPSNVLKKVLYVGWNDYTANTIKTVCDDMGLEFNRYTEHKLNFVDEINNADLCIGIGRHLIEAMMCGRPVVSVDNRDWMNGWVGAGYIKAENYYCHQRDNYSGRLKPVITDPKQLKEHIEMYDVKDGKYIYDLVRLDHGEDEIASQFSEIIYG